MSEAKRHGVQGSRGGVAAGRDIHGDVNTGVQLISSGSGDIVYSVPLPGGETVEVDAAGLERAYFDAILEAPDLANMPVPPFGSVPIEELYVSPSLAPASGTTSGSTETAMTGEVMATLDVLTQFSRVVVIAGPGVGKTTFLRNLARQVAAGKVPGTIPVLVSLNAYVDRGQNRDLLSFGLQELLGDLSKAAELEALGELLRVWHREGRVVFLLDGLDEVPEDERHGLLTDIAGLRRFVLTSRPSARVDANQERDGTLQLLPLDGARIALFVRNWIAVTGEAFRGEALLDYLRKNPKVADLATVPQLLGLICWLWGSDDEKRYRTKAELLARAARALVDRAADRLRLPAEQAEVMPARLLRWLRRVALEMMRAPNGVRVRVSTEELLDSVGSEDAGGLMQLARWTGLLVPASGVDQYQFLHLAFQEYLAADALTRVEDLPSVMSGIKDREHMEECLRLMCAILGEREDVQTLSSVLDRMMAREDTDIFRLNWRLAALCMSEVPDVERHLGPAIRRLAEGLMESASEWWARGTFAAAMGELRTPTMRDILASRLEDENPHVRWAAAEGLARMADARSLDILLDRLQQEPWPPVRSALVEGLGRIGDKRAVPALCDATNRRGPYHSWEAQAVGQSLARIDAVGALLELMERDEDLAGLLALGAMPYLRSDSAKQIERWLEVRGHTISYTGEDPYSQAVPLDQLDEQLASENAEARRDAVRILGHLGGDAAVMRLMDSLLDDDELVQQTSIEMLVRMSDDAAALVYVANLSMILLFESEDAVTRKAAGDVLFRLWLADAARSDLLNAQERLIPTIESYGTDRAVRLLGDEDGEVRTAVAWMLGLLPGPLEALTAALDDKTPSVRWVAAWSLGLQPDQRSVAHLLRRLSVDDSPEVLEMIAIALGAIGGSEVIQPLISSLASRYPAVRSAAAVSLGEIGDGRAAAPLLPLLRDGDPGVRMSVIRALGQVGSADVTAALVEQSRDDDPAIRRAAIEALGYLGDPAAIPALTDLLRRQSDPEVGEALAAALTVLDGPGLEDAFLGALDHKDVRIRRAVVQELADVATGASAAAMLALLREDDEALRELAAKIIGKAASPKFMLEAAHELAREQSLGPLTELGAGILERGDRELASRFTQVLAASDITATLGLRAIEIASGQVKRRNVRPRDGDPGTDWIDFYSSSLRDDDPLVRWDAVVLLEELKDERTIAPLMTCLLDPDPRVCGRSAEALATLAGEERLEQAVTRALARGISEFAERGVLIGVANKLLDDPDSDQQTVLGQIEVLCTYLSAYSTGNTNLRPVLWEIGERYRLRLLSSGEVIAATGQRLQCEEAVARILTSTTG